MELNGIGWLQWKRDEQTQKFIALLKADVAEIQQDWLDNRYVSDSEFKTLMLNAGALAGAQAVQLIINAIESIQAEGKDASE